MKDRIIHGSSMDEGGLYINTNLEDKTEYVRLTSKQVQFFESLKVVKAYEKMMKKFKKS